LLPHVINFELPNIPEDYVHRIGRTGRAGAKGEALSLVSSEENNYLRDIEKLIGNRIQISTVEGFEPDPNYVPTEKTQRSRVKHKSRNPNKGFPRRGSRR
jgi:ATP-dependent RNA helicase RhlE